MISRRLAALVLIACCGFGLSGCHTPHHEAWGGKDPKDPTQWSGLPGANPTSPLLGPPAGVEEDAPYPEPFTDLTGAGPARVAERFIRTLYGWEWKKDEASMIPAMQRTRPLLGPQMLPLLELGMLDTFPFIGAMQGAWAEADATTHLDVYEICPPEMGQPADTPSYWTRKIRVRVRIDAGDKSLIQEGIVLLELRKLGHWVVDRYDLLSNHNVMAGSGLHY